MTRRLRRVLGAVPLAFLLIAPSVATAATLPKLSAVVIANVGSGYAVISQGPVDPNQFVSSSPDPAAAAGALKSLAGSIDTYQRVWQDADMHNEVQDLVVRFSSTSSAQSFVAAVQHSLSAGEIVSSAPLPEIPGAVRATYFGTTTHAGVGQAIALRTGTYVVVLSTFSTTAANAQPINESDAITLARAQRTAAGQAGVRPGARSPRHASRSALGPGIIAAGVLATVLLVVWSRRRLSEQTVPGSPQPPVRTS
jgi:hypothetical protein